MNIKQRKFLTFLRFVKDVRGSIAVMAVLSAMGMVLALGCAVDMTRLIMEKAKYSHYADSSALLAANQVTQASTPSAAQTMAQNAFNQMAVQDDSTTVAAVTATVTDGQGKRTVNLTYQATVQMDFMGILGLNSVVLNGTTTVIGGIAQYSDFYVLFDNTPSMGLAATNNDITNLQNLTVNQPEGSCAFACHQMNASAANHKKNSSIPAVDNYNIAEGATPPVQLRVDSVRNAVASLLNAIQSNQSTLNNFRAGIYSFGPTAQTAGLTLISAPSSNIPAVTTAANSIQLMTVPYQNYNDDTQTNFDSIWGSLNANVPNSGDGSALNVSRKYVFFVSDGEEDSPSSTCTQKTVNYTDINGVSQKRCQSPINPALCTALKNRGITIVSIYTTYLQVLTDNWYVGYVEPYNAGPFSPSPNSLIAKNMQACATPGFYQEVGPKDSLASTMNTMFQKILATPRIQS